MASILKGCLGKLVQCLGYGLCTFLLVACGGGGGSAGNTSFGSGGSAAGGGSSSSSAGKITIALFDASGNASNSLTGSNTLTVKATVTSGGAPAKNVLVTFKLGASLATLSPSSGTALTDDTGVAQISLKSANTGSGADEVTATATVGTTAISAKTAFSIGASPSATPIAIKYVSVIPADKSIVIKGSGGNGRTEVALLTFNVIDSSGSGVPNVPVSFATQSTNPVTLVSSTGTTDSNGNVTVAVNSGTLPTAVTVIATVQGTSISVVSTELTVTTGQAVQAAFSLSLAKYYVEGWSHDNTQDTVTVLLADQFGAAVADGTQVVFTVDSGAIVGDGGAKCLTVKGGCTVTWRSQNPRSPNGVVTLIATATNGSANLSTSQKFFNSGSYASVYRVSSTSTQGGTTRNPSTPDPTINLDFSASCDPQSIRIEIVDENGNPMPEGTTITGALATNASLTAFPATVALSGLPFGSSTRGTVHDIIVTPAGCDLAGSKTKSGSIRIQVQSPLGGSVANTLINLGTFKGS
jgi:hypothetical protein